MESMLTKRVADTKLGKDGNCIANAGSRFLEVLDGLEHWLDSNKINFNRNKYKIEQGFKKSISQAQY